MGWAYHYSQTLFGSGSHYLLFDEDDDGEGADPYASTPPCLLPLLPPPLPPPSPPPAPDLRTLLKSGTLCANGESAAWCERLKRTLLTGAPLASLTSIRFRRDAPDWCEDSSVSGDSCAGSGSQVETVVGLPVGPGAGSCDGAEIYRVAAKTGESDRPAHWA